jgi:HNH endonuclease
MNPPVQRTPHKLADANRTQIAITREWFLRKVEKTPDCWWWRGCTVSDGYGLVVLASHMRSPNGKRVATTAHRVAWQLFKGEIPDKLCVLHKCDQRRCVNPAHLFLGTSLDNARDRAAKGRNGFPTLEQRAHGEQFSRTLMTARAVKRLRELRSHGMTVKEAVLKTFLHAARGAIYHENWRRVGDNSANHNGTPST